MHPFRELPLLTASLSGIVIADSIPFGNCHFWLHILFQDMPFLCVSNPLNSSFLRFW